MISNEAKKAHRALDKVDAALDRIAALPLHELTLEERLMLWAQLEILRLALAKVANRAQREAS
jgi:hypothetical protein